MEAPYKTLAATVFFQLLLELCCLSPPHTPTSTFSQTPMLFPENEVKQALILGDGCFVRLNNLVSISAVLNYTVL